VFAVCFFVGVAFAVAAVAVAFAAVGAGVDFILLLAPTGTRDLFVDAFGTGAKSETI
jgi:hypothetical protein